MMVEAAAAGRGRGDAPENVAWKPGKARRGSTPLPAPGPWPRGTESRLLASRIGKDKSVLF